MKTSSRRSGRALTSCLRVALAEGSYSRPAISRSFLRELKRLDPRLELVFVDGIGKWVLYSIARKGVISSEDYMVKELELPREPGAWLLDWLRKNDKTRGGAVCPEYADRRFMEKLSFEPKREEEAIERRNEERLASFAHNIENHVLNARKSQSMAKGTTEILKKTTRANA